MQIKVQTITCLTCNKVYAATVLERDGKVEQPSANWYKACAKAMATENARIDTVEHGDVFDDKPVGKCCGKKVKQKK